MRCHSIIFLLSLAAPLLAACGQDTVIGGDPYRPDERTVAFGYYAAGSASTRAQKETFVDGATNLTIPEGQRVGVFGFYQGQTDWTPGTFTADFMYNLPLAAGEAVKVMDTASGDSVVRCSLNYDKDTDKKYWPNTPGDKLAFIAYYPWNEAPSDDELASLDSYIQPVFTHGGGIGTFRFKVASNTKDQLDFMVSDSVVNQTKPGVNDRVRLTFHHALSAVTASVTRAQDLIDAGGQVANISYTLSGVRSTGTCHPVVSNDGRLSFTWDGLTNDASFQVDTSSTGAGKEAERTLLIIPQPLTTAVLTVTYDIEFHETVDGTDYVSYSYRDNVATFQLNSTAESSGTAVWRAGLRYNYNVIVSLTAINIEPSISQWTTGTMETDLNNPTNT